MSVTTMNARYEHVCEKCNKEFNNKMWEENLCHMCLFPRPKGTAWNKDFSDLKEKL